MSTYSSKNFLGTVKKGDKTLKIYDISKKLRYEINPNIAYFFVKSNIVIIRIEDKNDIYLDFNDKKESVDAASKLNNGKKLITNVVIDDDGGLSNNEKNKFSYFHALSKSMINNNQKLFDSKYKSAHNVRVQDIWGSEINTCETYSDAVNESLTNSAITLHEQVVLTPIPDSKGQAWYFNSGGTFIRPWISPQDIPFPITNLPSNGFKINIFRGDDATTGTPGSLIDPTINIWSTEYHTGIVHFGVGNTPNDFGWGTIKATFFQYTGIFGIEGITDAFRTVDFNSSSNELTFNSGTTSETTIIISGGKLSNTNSNMNANTTNSGNTLACDIPLYENLEGSKVFVYINGVQVSVGNNQSDDCYFSNDDGLSKKESGQEEVGDLLYWNYDNGIPISGYDLSELTDRITFLSLK